MGVSPTTAQNCTAELQQVRHCHSIDFIDYMMMRILIHHKWLQNINKKTEKEQ